MDRLLSVTDVAELVGFTAYTVRVAINAGELRAIKMRGRWKIEPAEVEAWKERCKEASTPLPVVVRDLPRPITRMKIPEGGFRQLAREQNRAEREAA